LYTGRRELTVAVDTTTVLRALAEPRRQAILRLIRDKPCSVGEIASHFDVTQQGISQHLQVLKHAGLVGVQQDRQRHLYTAQPEGLRALNAFLAELWPSGLQRLKEVVEAELHES
jgi:DNA-binding transcriptional ArsR family regulator